MRTLLLLLTLPVLAACQNPSWQTATAGDVTCGAVLRSPLVLQVYCYRKGFLFLNSLVNLEGPGDYKNVAIPQVETPSKVFDSQQCSPTIVIWWHFLADTGGIRWEYAADGVRGSGLFTKVYGQP